MKKKIAVFASGTGSNFINIIKKIYSHRLSAQVCLLVSNNPNSGAVKFASNNKMDVFIYNSDRFPGDNEQNSLIQKLEDYDLDLILLAGYMKKIRSNGYSNNRLGVVRNNNRNTIRFNSICIPNTI